MKIVLVTAYFPPRPSAGANRLSAFARGLRRAGMDITVFAPLFGEEVLAPDDQDLAGITQWTAMPEVSRNSFLRRFLDETRVCFTLMRRARQADHDACIVTTPFMSAVLLSIFLINRKKLVIDIRDLSWTYSVSGNSLVRFCQSVIGYAIEAGLRRAALIVTSTEAELEHIRSRNLNANCHMLSNGVEHDFVAAMDTLTGPRATSGIGVTYIGTLGRAQGAGILVDAAAMAPDISFQLIGDGDERSQITSDIRQRGLENITAPGWVARSQLKDIYTNSSVLFLRLQDGYKSAVPSKVYEYAAAGRPIIYMGRKEDAAWQRLSEFAGAHFVPDNDAEALVDCIRTARDLEIADARQNRARIQAHYTREAQADRLAGLIREMAST